MGSGKYYPKMVKRLFTLLTIFSLLFILATPAFASIVLKIVVANPSDTESQTMPVKVYLPKETKPENVIEKGDLDIGYDTQQGSYYVHGEYELEPSEVLEREVELEDIWVIPSDEIESLRQEAEKIKDLLKNTEFARRVSFLVSSINKKLNKIEEEQQVVKPNPEDHISSYRYHLKLIDSAKTDLAVARSMLNKVKPFSTTAVWKLMIFALIFLAILGTSFYFIWSKQIKIVGDKGPSKERADQDSKPDEDKKEEEEGDTKGEDDIEKIIRGE